MAIYAIGDIQGCYSEFMGLLGQIEFNPGKDTLWICGDMVNRGPDSLSTLRYIYQHRHCMQAVLGNHDLHLLAIARGQQANGKHDSLSPILKAADREELLDWLQQLPLCFYDRARNYLMVHAGLFPYWDVNDALRLSREVESSLQSEDSNALLKNMYGNQPDTWREELEGFDRLRCIINYFTRMRICDGQGKLQLQYKGDAQQVPEGYQPWFNHPQRQTRGQRIVFGHWAALGGQLPGDNNENAYGLDTACVWGQALTAMNLDNQQIFSIAAGGAE